MLLILDNIQEEAQETLVCIYCRVSSSENKDNLDRQAERLISYANAKGYKVAKVVKEVGSGLNDQRPKLMSILADPTLNLILVEHKDRLTRFGYHIILCQIVWIKTNKTPNRKIDSILKTGIKMYTTASIFIKRSNPLFGVIDEYAFLCKNLKNSALYLYRQAFFKKDKTPNKHKVITDFTKIKQPDYCAIPRKVSQQIIIQVAQDFSSFWGALKYWLKNKDKEDIEKPEIPKYLHKQRGRANVVFTKQAISRADLQKGFLTLSPFDKQKPIRIPLGKFVQTICYEQIKGVRLVKVENGYDIKITYQLPDVQPLSDKPNRILSVDLGINNLMSVGSNLNIRPLLIKGVALKSFNQYYNKKLASLNAKKERYKKLGDEKAYSNAIERLHRKRKHKVRDYLHKTSRILINHAVNNQIDTIVVGYNKGWKQEIELGSVNNQKFTFIPFLTLLTYLEHKARQYGITLIRTEESYTSKCSFLDNESLCKQDHYQGKRVKRGLFCSSTGQLINADINGAMNILRKVIGDFQFDPIQVCSTPKVICALK